MARTEAEILASFQASVADSDPSADVKKGPLYDLVGLPLASTLAPTEQQVDVLEQIYSAQFALIASTDQANAFINNWSEAAGAGNPSQGKVYFMRFARPQPDEIIPIPVGSVVGNLDRSNQYIAVESATIVGANADTYYNAQRRTFEVAVQCVAVANGANYDLPAGRINTIISQVNGIDAVENREPFTGGQAAETTTAQIQRVQKKFEGTAINTAAGAATRIQSYNPTLIRDVRTVTSNDRQLFRRITYLPGEDHYLLAEQFKTVNETYTSIVGGETEIPLVNVPVESINTVTLNGVSITNFALVSDTSLETGLSARARDKMLLTTSLIAGDVLVINLTYNSILQEVQQNVLNQSKLFNTDELARNFRPVPIRIEMQGKTLTSFDPGTVKAEIEAELFRLIEPGKWTELFFPSVVLEDVRSTVKGLSSLSMLTFQRTTQALSQIETVQILDNELARYQAAFVSITLRGT